jgi:hypothetical protein
VAPAVPPLGKTGAPPLDEMYWCGDQCPEGWSIIELNPAPYGQGMMIGRRSLFDELLEVCETPADMGLGSLVDPGTTTALEY